MKLACCMVAFAGGMLAGGVVALLFAPKKGSEVRKDNKERIDDAKAHLKEEISCCKPAARVVEENVTVSMEE